MADNGANIVGRMLLAFDYLEDREGKKIVRMVRPVLKWDSNPAQFKIGVNADFDTNTLPLNEINFAPSSAARWDSGYMWDGGAMWGGNLEVKSQWTDAAAEGWAIAPYLEVTSRSSDVRVVAFDVSYESGGVL